eukprot:c17945_g1_i1.p1 GENE.c17945_g1_i1~~c17945_g1_i1.p1  ORF type:complete len:223 (-),score=48.25 c17945_g1_i1:31-699(-)
MTFFHFCNCVALAYIPPVLIFNSLIGESESAWRCSHASLGYIATQLVKMILMATFMNTGSSSNGFDFIQELTTAIISGIDFMGLYFVLNYVKSSTKFSKYLLVTLGWGQTDNILRNFVFFWNGARGKEFEWTFLFQAIKANLDMVVIFAVIVFVSGFKKRTKNFDLPQIGLGLYLLVPMISNFFLLQEICDPFFVLLFQIAFTAFMIYACHKTFFVTSNKSL